MRSHVYDRMAEYIVKYLVALKLNITSVSNIFANYTACWAVLF